VALLTWRHPNQTIDFLNPLSKPAGCGNNISWFKGMARQVAEKVV
jgi:hypothetical protein